MSLKTSFFLDEVGFSVSSRPKRGISFIGTSAYVHVPAVRTRNISVLAAMNKYSMIFNKFYERALSGEDFKNTLLSIKEKCMSLEIQNPIFILDNVSIHHYRGMNNIINEHNITSLFLPPYSPFLNPIENCFSKWKNYVLQGEAKNENEYDY
ncbi:hypothetical protein DMUE_0934 [Dictyocoela muelleri]|nr:hypothetical protein DMUE_0934 [Dictyocoela muelleri]